MTTMNYPSDRYPALSAVAIELPDGWEAGVAPDALVVGFDTSSPSHFRTNVLVSVSRTLAELPIDAIAKTVASEAAAADPTFQVFGEEAEVVGGHEAVVRLQGRRVTATADVTIDVLQMEALVVVPTRNPALADLVQVHATCAADVADAMSPVFRSILESLEVTPA
jgi:hypothetical protein